MSLCSCGIPARTGAGFADFLAVPRDLFLLTAHTGDFLFLFLNLFLFYFILSHNTI